MKGKSYPIASMDRRYLPESRNPQGYAAIYTGEKRYPREGEWYLSGAIVEAYYAPNDITIAYPIAQICRIETQEVLIPV